VFQQEAPLKLRGQRGRCTNIKGKPQIFGSFPSPRPRPLFPLVVKFVVGFGKPSSMPNLKLLASAVAQILKGNPKTLGSFNSTGPRPLFLRCGILWWALTKPNCVPNLKSLASAIVKILKGILNFRELTRPRATPTLSSACDFMMGLSKPQMRAELEVASPSSCRNIIGEPKIFRSSPSPRPPPFFLWVWFYDGPWQT